MCPRLWNEKHCGKARTILGNTARQYPPYLTLWNEKPGGRVVKLTLRLRLCYIASEPENTIGS
jgi:hypothetical protein